MYTYLLCIVLYTHIIDFTCFITPLNDSMHMLQDLRGLLAQRCALRCPWTLRMFCALGVSGEQQLPGGGRRTGHGWTALWKLHQRFLGEVAFLGWGKIDVGLMWTFWMWEQTLNATLIWRILKKLGCWQSTACFNLYVSFCQDQESSMGQNCKMKAGGTWITNWLKPKGLFHSDHSAAGPSHVRLSTQQPWWALQPLPTRLAYCHSHCGGNCWRNAWSMHPLLVTGAHDSWGGVGGIESWCNFHLLLVVCRPRRKPPWEICVAARQLYG